MTQLDFYEAVMNNQITDTVTEYAKIKFDQMHGKEKREETSTIRGLIVETLKSSEEPLVASDLAEIIGYSVQKTSAMLKRMLSNGEVKRKEMAIEGRGLFWGYSLAAK